MATEKPYVYTTYKKIRLENNIVERCEKKVSDFYDNFAIFFLGISDTGRFQCNRRDGGSSGGWTSPALWRPAALHVWDSTTRPVLPAAEHQGRSRDDFNLHQNVIEEIQWCALKNVGLLHKKLSLSHLSPHSVSPFSACSYNKLWRRKVPVQLSWELFPKHWGTHRTAATG